MASLLAVSAIGLAMMPLLGAAPAVAAPSPTAPSCPGAGLHGSAAADLFRLDLLDLRPLGIKLGPVAAVRLASTRSGLSGKPASSVAAARYLDASVLGLASVPTRTAVQQAPPVNQHANQLTAGAVELAGVLKVGVGKLTASASWPTGEHCGMRTGQAATSSAAIADATVLPNGNTSLLRVPNALNSGTATGLVVQGDRVGAAAGARIGLADLRLFAGTGAEIGVQVINEPTLAAIAGGSKGTPAVRYTSPILKVSLPGGHVEQLDAPGRHLDIAVPPPASANASAHASASRRAATEGLPVLTGDPLGKLLAGLHPGNVATTGAPAATGPLGLSGLPVLPGLPAVGALPLLNNGSPAGSGSTEATSLLGNGSLAVLRLSIGSLDKHVTATSVHAQAATLRLQLLLQPTGTPRRTVSLLDLGIGVLETAATAPAPVTATPVPPAAPTIPGAAPTPVSLPVTGSSLTWVIVGGVLLAATGRLLMVLARRRNSD